MELRTEIKQEFLAVINGIEFNHEGIYYTVFRILSAIDTKFSPEKLPENFVEELKYAVTEKYNNDGFELSEIESRCIKEIYESGTTFENFSFSFIKREFAF
jgi:hypothetical protein